MTVRSAYLPLLSIGVVCIRPFAATDAAALVEIWIDATIRTRNTVPEPSAQLSLPAATHAFSQGLVRVPAECKADNAASIRSFFVSDAGAHVDAEMFALLLADKANAPAFRSSK
jgi:hypothetical protein